MADFILGFDATWRVLLRLAGGCAAVLLLALAALAALTIAAALFDWTTGRLAKRWRRNGYVPKGKLGRIILGEDGGG